MGWRWLCRPFDPPTALAVAVGLTVVTYLLYELF